VAGTPALVRRFEDLEGGKQGAIAMGFFTVVLFLVNLGPFHQPVLRAALYGLIEAIPFAVVVVIAASNERQRRLDREGDGTSAGA